MSAQQPRHPVEAEEVMAYLDGELAAARATEVGAHVEQCSVCQAVAADLRVLSAGMSEWQVPPSPERIITGVNAVLHAAQRRKERLVRPWFVALAAATSFMLILAMAIPNLLRSRSGTPLALVSVPNDKREAATQPLIAGQTRAAAPMIIFTVSLRMVAGEFDNARARLDEILRTHNGHTAQLATSSPQASARTMSAMLRFPAGKLDAAVAELKKLGRVENEQRSGNEVTQQYVDLVARLNNARNTEQRLIEVLRERTGKVGDVLEVEKEIARVRGEIERMQAEQKHLENQVTFATVQIELREERKAALEAAPASVGTRLWNAMVDGYRSATETVMGLALFALSYGPPLLVWVAVLFFPARWLARRTRAISS
jgi:hypothetical protein